MSDVFDREDVGSEMAADEELALRCCSVTGFGRALAAADGMSVRSLPAGTSLVVHTRNTRYRLILLEGGRDAVLVQGGVWFPTLTEAQLQGATAGGSLVKAGWIAVGLRLELSLGLERIVTSPVRFVSVESLPPGIPSARA